MSMAYNKPTIDSLDRRQVMESYFPEFLRGNKDFRVFIKLATEELGLVSDYIELFTDLTNVDTTPEQFIEDLGNMVGYTYIDEVNPDMQREIIKRIFNKHEARGDEDSMLMMASHAPNNGYLGGDIFVPGTYQYGQDAVLVFPRDTLFTWNKSKRSGYDRFPDGISAIDGVIEILIGYLDDNVKARVESVKPAGVKLSFKMNVVISNDGELLKIRLPVLYTQVNLWITTRVNSRRVSQIGDNCWSGSSRSMRRSGNQRAWFCVGPEIGLVVPAKSIQESLIPLYYSGLSWKEIYEKCLEIPMGVVKSYKGVAGFDESFIWSGRRGRSGMKTGEHSMFVSYRHEMNLNNSFVPLMANADKPISGWRDPTQDNVLGMVEVIIERGDSGI